MPTYDFTAAPRDGGEPTFGTVVADNEEAAVAAIRSNLALIDCKIGLTERSAAAVEETGEETGEEMGEEPEHDGSKESLIALLKHHHPNFHRLDMEFDGSGDSGEFQSVQAVDASGGTLDLEVADLATTCEEWGTERLEELGYDWYNNDGGYGTITLYDDGSGTIETHIRITETEDYEDDA
jgi:hypothetical protein